ncbi:hypothetical protein C1Y40_04896 [Mycobacterium talmoniae]|uniref:Uncharacterized protein n=1 Tax=Mycobacterium talmoniae TaxID=1858794 RepID=A0A2S8BE80_9MYCO|nr:hypothetical protein C1Y40_04896 [Mycobacterium talmoniae]
MTTQCPPSIDTTRPPDGMDPVNRCNAGVTKMSRRGASTCTATVVDGSGVAGDSSGAGILARYKFRPLR